MLRIRTKRVVVKVSRTVLSALVSIYSCSPHSVDTILRLPTAVWNNLMHTKGNPVSVLKSHHPFHNRVHVNGPAQFSGKVRIKPKLLPQGGNGGTLGRYRN